MLRDVEKVTFKLPGYFISSFTYQNNSTSSLGFLGQWFNNLQPGCTFDIILMSSVHYDKILSKFGEQQLVMVNYVCGFNQSEIGKYFWMNNKYTPIETIV